MIIISRLIKILLLCIIFTINHPIQAQIGYSYSDLDSVGFLNAQHDSLVNGIYLVSLCYHDLVETQITYDTIPGIYMIVKKGFWVFKKVHKVRMPPRLSKNRKTIQKRPFTVRNSYPVLYRPIALPKDIIRIHEFLDEVNINQLPYRQVPPSYIKGLTIKLKDIDTTNLCESIYDDICCFRIGLVLDNKLISISDTYKFIQSKFFPEKSVRFPFTDSQNIMLNQIKELWVSNFKKNQQNDIAVDVKEIRINNNELIHNYPPERLHLVTSNNENIEFLEVKPEIGALYPSYPICNSRELSAFTEVLSISRSYYSISNYFILKDNKIIEIDSREKFKEIYGIVESKEEAFSYAVALFIDPSDEILYCFDFLLTTKDKYSVYSNELKTPQVEKKENGYLVVLTVRHLNGEYFEKTIFVHNTGDVELLKQEIVLINNSNHIIAGDIITKPSAQQSV